MKTSFKNWRKSLFVEVSQQFRLYFLLTLILASALFLRVYKLDQLLGFYYDQGRDAFVVWDLLHQGNFFLVGPITGIEGIFLGPFYYYLITPFYFLSGGSPVFVAAVLNIISVLGILFLYLITKEFFDRKVALLTVFLTSFSYSLVIFSRWLSHPPLLPTFSLVIIYSLLQIYKGKEKWWLMIGLFLGICLQLEAASAIFFIPTILIFGIWQYKKTKHFLFIIVSIFLFLLTLVPQVAFDFRHQGGLQQAFQNFLLTKKSFHLPLGEFLEKRLNLYLNILFSKLFYAKQDTGLIWLLILTVLGILKRKEIFAKERKILALWFFIPLAGYLFYQGNLGLFWDYYLSGVWLVFLMLVSFLLVGIWPKVWGKSMVVLFLALFLYLNISQLFIYHRIGVGILLRDQIGAIDWIYQDVQERDFNLDIYVPPVIPYAYDYLFKWYGENKYHRQPVANRASFLYTLFENDTSNPKRFRVWLENENAATKVISEKSFGEITVQKRERINDDEK